MSGTIGLHPLGSDGLDGFFAHDGAADRSETVRAPEFLVPVTDDAGGAEPSSDE